MKRRYRALALFSGGLDSLLSVLLMQKLGNEVIPIFFKTPFFTEEKAKRCAEANGLSLQVIDISEIHLAMLKNPRYGYGKNFNPCIDCHGLMFNQAGLLLDKYKADFLISGEVLGQRPMSQRKDAMDAVGKLSGYKELLIRPLSQRLLQDTKPITEGWINKDDLLAFQGRSRKPQLALANELSAIDIPSSGGGCRLTDKNFTVRLLDLLNHQSLNLTDIELLKQGRHFRLSEKIKLVVGRNEHDNQAIESIKHSYLYLFDDGKPGPLGLYCASDLDNEILELAASIVAYYNHKASDLSVISYGSSFPLHETLHVEKASSELVEKLMIKR